jgi:hypothetical protein
VDDERGSAAQGGSLMGTSRWYQAAARQKAGRIIAAARPRDLR